MVEQRYNENIALVQGLQSTDQVSRIQFEDSDINKKWRLQPKKINKVANSLCGLPELVWSTPFYHHDDAQSNGTRVSILETYDRWRVSKYWFPIRSCHYAICGCFTWSSWIGYYQKLEDQINTISGIKQITSRSSEGLSMVIAEFNLDTSSAIAAQDVRDKIAPVIAQFRDEIDTPIVQRYDPSSSPIMSVVFESNSMSLAQLSSYVDKKLCLSLKLFLVWVMSIY